jgi:NTP pyrophosphatase (non-canonical NTP hydrolase)
MLNKVIERIVSLTKSDGKSGEIFFLSLVEEVGELAKAIKVERGIVKHKKLEEGVEAEAADVFICAIGLASLYGRVDEFNLKEFSQIVDGMFNMVVMAMGDISKSIASSDAYVINMYCLLIAQFSANLRKGSLDEFYKVVMTKLDKWEKIRG